MNVNGLKTQKTHRNQQTFIKGKMGQECIWLKNTEDTQKQTNIYEGKDEISFGLKYRDTH